MVATELDMVTTELEGLFEYMAEQLSAAGFCVVRCYRVPELRVTVSDDADLILELTDDDADARIAASDSRNGETIEYLVLSDPKSLDRLAAWTWRAFVGVRDRRC